MSHELCWVSWDAGESAQTMLSQLRLCWVCTDSEVEIQVRDSWPLLQLFQPRQNYMLEIIYLQSDSSYIRKSSTSQVANRRPAGRIQPSTLFYPARHLVSTGRRCWALALLLRSNYIYTVLKLRSALWRQPRGWCGPWWKWLWHLCSIWSSC